MSHKFVTLTYHRVRPQRDPLYPDMCFVDSFDSQLRVLSRFFNVLPLPEALERSEQGSLPARSVCITFDDGYRDNVDIALPMLRQFALPATFFIATGYLNDGMMWNDQVIEAVRGRRAGRWDLSGINLGERHVDDLASRRALMHEIIVHLKHQSPDVRATWAQQLVDESSVSGERIMMTDAEIRTLHAAGMTIGGHTVTHPILTRLSQAQGGAEMTDGKRALEDMIQSDVSVFAFPNGKAGADYAKEHTALVEQSGFRAGLTTMWGYADNASPRFELPRVGLESESGWRFGAKLFKSFYEAQDATTILSSQTA
ncbi:MAG: polysaccharide deacetylase family protein [Gammaproteobacteria bacterium]